MATLEEDLDQYAKDLGKITRQDFWKGIGIMLKMGGEISAWIGVIIASFKAIAVVASVFPPALACHIFTPALLTKTIGAVSRVYCDLPAAQRRSVSTALGGLQALADPTEPQRMMKVFKVIVGG